MSTSKERRMDWERRYAEWQAAQDRLKAEAEVLIRRLGAGKIYYDWTIKNPIGMGRGGYVPALVLTFEEIETLLSRV